MKYTIEEIKELLSNYYEEDYWDVGCYVDGFWLSVKNIIKILERGK